MDIRSAAKELKKAELYHFQIPMISEENSDMIVEDAYAIQLANIQERVKNGETITGMKIGLTSKGMQTLLGVSEPDYGHLMNTMEIPEGFPCPLSELIQPKVEAELAFRLKKTLRGPGVTLKDVYAATDYVSPALEIVDSRIKNWKIKITDTIADNGSSARYVIGGTRKRAEDVDMRLCGMVFEKNGEFVNSGTTAEVMGNPVASVAWLANKLAEFNISIKAGSIVLAGALTAAQVIQAEDTFTASFCDLGSVSCRFI